jgi:hypothetical protein
VADTWTWDEAACRARLMVAPDHPISPWVTDLRGALEEIDRLRAKLDEADGVIAAATSAITEQLNRAVALRRECDRLRAALRPFAAWAARFQPPPYHAPGWDDGHVVCADTYDRTAPTLGDCRRAAAALGGRP